jgi:molecular chaperone HtpG
MDDVDSFLPRYLRFAKGIVDSKDLPLNVSREILQDSALVTKIKTASIKRILTMLDKLSKNDEEYQKLWDQLGKVLKEGPIEDPDNKEKIAKLLRFASTANTDEKQSVSLDAYIERMKDKQEDIYYITAESYTTAKHSPQLEVFNAKGIEVLLLTDPVDEWLTSHLTEYHSKKLQSVSKGDLDLDKFSKEKKKEKDSEKLADDFADTLKRIKEALGDTVQEVRLTERLTTSPTCIVSAENDMGLQMQKMLQAAGHALPPSKPIFEINAEHKLIKHLQAQKDESNFKEWTTVLFDQAVLAEGGHLPDPAGFVQRLNRLLEQLS